MNKAILDVGCGEKKEPGAIGLDQYDLPGVDVVCNLDKTWPLADGSFDKVIFRHSINHIASLQQAIKEACRVLKSKGEIYIVAPHFTSDNIFTDPTVKFFLGYRSLDYYCCNTSSDYQYYGRLSLCMVYRRIYLYKAEPKSWEHKILNSVVWPLEYIIHLSPRLYEKFFCFMLRANEIKFVLRVD